MSKNTRLALAQAAPPVAHCPFALSPSAGAPLTLELLVSAPGSQTAPHAIWSRAFQCSDDIAAVVSSVTEQRLDLAFLGHLTLNFGVNEADRIVDEIIAEAHAIRESQAQAAAEEAINHLVVELFGFKKYGAYFLQLQRKSRNKPDWSIRYSRATERDRLCDWLKWQKPRFREFLDYAAEFGTEELSKLLLAEMFETERRVKKEGCGAGGARPLRMWRGT